MLETLTSESKCRFNQYDTCVIGAGAAGITIARELAHKGRSVFLAEAGGLYASVESQDHYRGRVIGDTYFDLAGTRLRFFGGSTAVWGGLCRELDPYDFEAKSASQDTRWPIKYEELRPYSNRAAQILQIPTQRPDRALNQHVNEIFFEFSPPVRFGQEFREEISTSSVIDSFMNCNFVGFEYDGESIQSARFVNYSGESQTINADRFVLACGGIENSRILLIQNQTFDNRLGNLSGLLGRYWTEHNVYTIGDFFLFDHDAFETKPRVSESGFSSRRIFVAPSRRFQEENEVLNCGLRLLPMFERTGAKKYLANLLCSAPELSNALLEPIGQRLTCAGTIRAAWEQVPSKDNKIVLANETDNFGFERCELHWKKSRRDKLAARYAALALGEYLARNDLGRIKLSRWLLDDDDEFPTDDELGGNHHMGGTRMANSSDEGVVDPNCRVYGTTNLYVAGSSVFPSGGHANPMFTTIQLALRLVDYLDGAS